MAKDNKMTVTIAGSALRAASKIRVPVAPPGSRHKSARDYDRKAGKQAMRRSFEGA